MSEEERIKNIYNFTQKPNIMIGKNIIIGGLNEMADKKIVNILEIKNKDEQYKEIKKIAQDTINFLVVGEYK